MADDLVGIRIEEVQPARRYRQAHAVAGADRRFGRDARDGRFNMTRLAISLSGRVNAVSKIHRDVSRRLLASAWPDFAPEDVPVDSECSRD